MGRKQLKYIELDDESGRLYVAGVPHLLFPVNIVELMRDILRKIAGNAAAEALMYRIGEEVGREYAKRVKKIFNESEVELDKDALLTQVYCTTMQSGWGGIKKIKWINPEDGKIEIRGRNFPCMELENCNCALERGILAGAYHEIVGKRIYYALTKKTRNEVVINSLEEIPPEVLRDEELALLSKRELEEIIREKTRELEKSRIATLNIAQDIENAKKELQESEEKLRAIVESAKDSIFIKDRELRYVLVNPAMERLFGLPAEKMLGKSDAELFGEERVKHIEEVDRQVLQGETVEDVYSKPVGREIKTFHTIKVPLRDASGKISGLCGIERDITEQKRMEDKVKEAMTKLKRFNRLAVGRELRMIELKREVNQLCERLGEKPRYNLSFVDNKITGGNENENENKKLRIGLFANANVGEEKNER